MWEPATDKAVYQELAFTQRIQNSRQSICARVGLLTMIWRLLRGLSSVTAASTGLLIVYGLSFAMERITTRLPMTIPHELATVTLWLLPWTLLYCAGLEDFVTVTRQAAVFWLGVAPVFAFLYYNERYTSDSLITKGAMPLLVILGGLLPHVVKRLRFLFTVFSLLAGVAGVFVLYFSIRILVSGGSFATTDNGIVIVGFGIAALATAVLSGAFLCGAKPKLLVPDKSR